MENKKESPLMAATKNGLTEEVKSIHFKRTLNPSFHLAYMYNATKKEMAFIGYLSSENIEGETFFYLMEALENITEDFELDYVFLIPKANIGLEPKFEIRLKATNEISGYI